MVEPLKLGKKFKRKGERRGEKVREIVKGLGGRGRRSGKCSETLRSLHWTISKSQQTRGLASTT